MPLSSKRPCFIKQEGSLKGVYLRVGASTRRAQQHHVEEIMREIRHQYYDEEPTCALLNDLSKERLAQCYGKSYSLKKLESDGVIKQLMVSPKKYSATVAGVLMFADFPDQIIPEAMIICTEFKGTNGRDIIQTRDLIGPIPELIEQSTALLDNWLQRNYPLHGVKLVGTSLIPKAALREAITNGLIHRKYIIPGAIKIALYNDRLEIFSPGSLPGLVDINNLGDGTTYLRNSHIAKLAKQLKLAEKFGTGIKLIFDECKKSGIKKPEYYEDSDFVKLIFLFGPETKTAQSDEEIIMKFLLMQQEATIKDIMALLDVSRNTATRKLNHLIEQSLVIRKRKGPGLKYFACQRL